MVSIRALTIRHTIGYILVLSVLILLSRGLWSYPQELKLAIEHQERDVISIQNAIRSTHESLTSMAYDYAHWKISQDFISLPTLENSNNTTKALFQLKDHEITYLAIISADGNIPIALHRNIEDEQVFDFDVEQRERLISTTYPALLAENELETFELFLGNSVMTSAVPIYAHQGHDHHMTSKTPLGWVVISWSLYGDNLKRLSDILQVEITDAGISNSQLIEKANSKEGQFLDLYSDIKHVAASFRIRCLSSFNQQLSGCMKIHHQEDLIPELFNLKTLFIIFIFSLIPFISFTIILRFLILPIERTTQYLRHAKNQNNLLKIERKIGITELDQARLAFNELIDTVNAQQEKLEKLSSTDALTQIPNRRALDLEIEKTWSRINRHCGNVVLILIDIDHFKPYNDFYGHPKGDEVLIKVAQSLQLFSRRSDDITARYGGEEFVILFQYNERQEIINLLQIINKTMEALNEPHEKSEFKHITVSCGACWIESEINSLAKKSISTWIETADKALYQAKENGRNQYEILPFDVD